MIKIAPISEDSADEKVAAVFSDLKNQLQLASVPYYFQIIAAFPDFLNLLWFKLRPVIVSESFTDLLSLAKSSTFELMDQKIKADPMIALLVTKMSEQEKMELEEMFARMHHVNATLLVLSIMVREAIKGLVAAGFSGNQGFLPQGQTNVSDSDLMEKSENTESNHSVATIPNLPTFFLNTENPHFLAFMQLVSEEMEKFFKTKDYLSVRLALEQKIQGELRKLPIGLDLPYREAMEILFNHPLAIDLLYLLHDAFPGYFPKQFVSSMLLEVHLHKKSNMEIGSPNPFLIGNESPKLLPES